MTDLDTQLRHYADYLDHRIGEPARNVIALDTVRAPRPRWHSAAAALLLVALVAAIVVWRHSTTPHPATGPWAAPTWSRATDPDGAFTPPSGTFVTPGDPPIATHNSVSIADVAVVDSHFVALGTTVLDGVSTATWWTSIDGNVWRNHPLADAEWTGLEPIEMAIWGDAIVATGWRPKGPTDDSAVVLARSDDGGTTWSDVPLVVVTDDAGRSMDAVSVSVVGDRLFLVGRVAHSYQTWVWSTTDGTRWTRSRLGDNGASAGAPVRAGTGYLAAGQDQYHRAAAWYSADGVTWERTDLVDTPANPRDWGTVESVAAGPNGLVAVGWSGDPDLGFGVVDGTVQLVDSRGRTPQWWWSADGRSWTPVGVLTHHGSIFGGWSAGVAASDDGYVIAESVVIGMREQTIIAASADGRTWEPSGTLDGSISAPVPGAGDVQWIAVGRGAYDYADGMLDTPEPTASETGRVWLGS